ncbi:hypothetical protein AKJ09_06296 [Labilithrix luteola]|uniref:Uncharacterized protein n=1 Tax=Labilithrix luteola TaxID=1391654 RepID=A0A0K1Q1L8_9BACT|nr:hypothetical protein AKJ09_06296 [Labilithrix luteola]
MHLGCIVLEGILEGFPVHGHVANRRRRMTVLSHCESPFEGKRLSYGTRGPGLTASAG